jgi:hypothetical protein
MKSLTFTSKRAILAAACAAVVGLLPSARASLTTSYQFNGNGNWSIDAIGSNNSPVGNLSAVVPLGSTIEKAFLYSTTYNADLGVSSVDFDGTLITAFTPLGINNYLQAYRADVTAQVAAKVGSGSASPFSFTINSENPNGYIDGELLAIVYSNPAESVRTIAFLDGFSTSAGDATGFAFANPITVAPGFEALMSLGIGFGYQPSGQYSTVDINGRRLTSSAGGYDDGVAENGGLITVGGLGDSPFNPDPYANDSGGTFTDDELYNLALGNVANPLPFLSTGDTGFTIVTQNPSGDDNIFFLGINVTAEGVVIDDPNAVPEPSTVIGGLALAALAASRMRRRNKA